MKHRNVADFCKNAVGAVFLLAGAFFVCSTLLSIRAVFADPIAPVETVTTTVTSPRNASPRTARNSSRNVNVARTTTGVAPAASRATVARTATSSRPVVARTASNQAAVASRAATNVNAAPATNTASRATATRNVVSRAGTAGSTRTTASRTTSTRTVRARTGTTNQARVSLTGTPIRGSKAAVPSSYTYLQNKLYTGNYSNIIDSTTGLISAEAYNNCMESYYTCMDEICTARNAAQRRCACAGRVKAFAEAETALETANEELIKVAGELALLIANKGKDVSSAFQLTDAEKVMNCVSWRDASKNGSAKADEFGDWCAQHGIYDSTCSATTAPSYCKDSGNNFGFDVSSLDGNGSDILAALQSWATAKENTITILRSNENNLWSQYANISDVVSGMAGLDTSSTTSETVKDSLANTWGYELFEYAHNNVCNRVLDSCFNGIYEACGAPPSSGRKCSNGAASCPYNYNSMISVTNSGTYELNFVSPSNSYGNATNTPACFGYASSSSDPYANLRGPVADARRSILQKYALDANADCDAYGEQLRATAQNIGYQKVAAQQALQQKRLEFANEERETVLADAINAASNFNTCLNDLYDCYESQLSYNPSWTTARIKTYCAQVSQSPACYETMICNPSTSPFKAIIDKPDNAQCKNTADYTTNTCRNLVTLNDILNKASTKGENCKFGDGSTCDSAAMREQCLIDAGVEELRNWKKCLADETYDPETKKCIKVAG